LSITISRQTGFTRYPIVAGLKNIPGYQDAVCLMLLRKNMFFMTVGSQRNMYKNTLGKTSLRRIALCTLSSTISAGRQKISKIVPSMLGYNVLNDSMQNSSFHNTWLYQKNV